MASLQEKGKNSHQWVRDIEEENRIRGLYLVQSKRTSKTRRGDAFLSLTLADRTGEVEAKVWERVDELSPLFNEGDVIDVKGIAGSYRNKIQVVLSDLKVPNDIDDPALFLESTPRNINKMIGTLTQLLKEIKSPALKSLANRFLSDQHFMSCFKKAPAAKIFHHNYLGGLLEHTLSVCQMTVAVTDHYPELDGDILLMGAFLHDIGKTKEFKFDRHIDYTDEGRLLGHLTLGITLLDEKLTGMKTFPKESALRLKHLMLSHHGQFEFGSPKRPKFLEAFALHLMDDLDAKINGLGRFMEKDRQEGAWTDFNRLFERYFLKGDIKMTAETLDTGNSEDDRQKALFT